jgi:hypothetical protein
MDVLVRFEDGVVELRSANCPFRHKIPDYDEALFESGLPTWEKLGRYVHTFDNCGRTGRPVYVWRITGGRGKGDTLTGEWQRATVETVEQQIARLTTERDRSRADRAADVGRLERRLRALGDNPDNGRQLICATCGDVAWSVCTHIADAIHAAEERGEKAATLAAAWEAVFRALATYRRHSFTAEWNAYEVARDRLIEAGGPDIRAEEPADGT